MTKLLCFLCAIAILTETKPTSSTYTAFVLLYVCFFKEFKDGKKK